MKSPAPSEVMDLGNIMNKKGVLSHQGIPVSAPDFHHQLPQLNARSLPDSPMDRADSPHGSEHSRYSAPRGAIIDNMPRSYPSPTAMHGPLHHLADSMSGGQMLLPGLPPPIHPMAHSAMAVEAMQAQSPVKAYACSTCDKRFARRSDLARHERIHSGHRPHVCDFANCGKQFIQRSALTVHRRVHTGEKPHMCESCSKHFSDSSSLARHRRIHTGRRPYKCPYADCQKTFTRRTTLTRHQNSHTGTLEEAAAATAAALAARATSRLAGTRSDVDGMSNRDSPMTTPSPGQRNLSMSPGADMANSSNLQNYITNSTLPVHMRGDMHVGSPSSTSSMSYTNSMRPTSHPTSYPPPTLEPNIEPHQSGPGSATGSPHMGSIGWQSPAHVPSPTSGNGYLYPEPEFQNAAAMNQMFYPNNPLRRPQSTEPQMNKEMWAVAQ